MQDIAGETLRAKPTRSSGPPRDFQTHIAALREAGLLIEIERPINKDTELHPLVRWQFQGGLAEDACRAFLFNIVTDGSGRRYGIPVAVSAIADSSWTYAWWTGHTVDYFDGTYTR